MAVWKKYNAVTGEYEEIPGTDTTCGTGGESSGSSTETLPDLSGKTAIFMGDSYTVGMAAMLKSMCAEFGLVADNRGKVSSSICGDVQGNKGFAPMWNRTKAVCSEYTAAGTTDSVALIVFMGGANDGFGPSTWIGSGITDTDTDHIYGAMHSILNDFRTTFPAAKIVTILQPAYFTRTVDSLASDDETAQFFGFTDLAAMQVMDDYQISNYSMVLKQNAVKEVAKFYNTEIVDCFSAWHSVFSANDRSKYWQSDKLHLTSAGYQDITNRLKAKIVEIF